MSNLPKPKFQAATGEQRFKERSVGEQRSPRPSARMTERQPNRRRENADVDKKLDKNRPHFSPKSGGKREENRASRKPEFTLQVTETQLGKVKVVTKSTGVSAQPKEKKTGPLSPRAPEKIKKNRAEEMKVFGENACFTLFAQRPESIVRVWTTVETAHKTGEMFSYLAANKKVYHVVDREELERVSGTEHHGGICMLVKKRRPFTLKGYLDITRRQDVVVLLDNVRNPQNIGGILRTCAVYGVKALVSAEPELIQSANAMRVAEGGAEFVNILQTNDTEQALSQLRQASYQVIYTSTDKRAKSLNKLLWTKKVVFVLSESDASGFAQNGDEVVNLSIANPLKTGLNVAVTAGVLLASRAK